jgi:hypothetical protein
MQDYYRNRAIDEKLSRLFMIVRSVVLRPEVQHAVHTPKSYTTLNLEFSHFFKVHRPPKLLPAQPQ